MNQLAAQMQDYWEGRAPGFSEYNMQELRDERALNWSLCLQEYIHRYAPDCPHDQIHILDVGTGPGFFAILLAQAGYKVTAVDYTAGMLAEAKHNAGDLSAEITWVQGDAQHLPFAAESFDCIVTRNVTWNLPEPEQAYCDWFRVLKADGFLLNFDADWYGYTHSEEKRQAYENDRKKSVETRIEDCNVGENFDVCEVLGSKMPLSRQQRPDWDLAVMKKAGFVDTRCRDDIWKEVWNKEEKISCASTPLFLLVGLKEDCKKRIVSYWSRRSSSFMAQRRRELHDPISQRWLTELDRYLPAKKKLKILDIGCGSGYFSILLSKQGHEVTGIDLTPEMIDTARSLAHEEDVSCRFEVMDAEAPIFEDESFDMIITRNCTWTLPHPDKAYEQWMRVLIKGGLILNFDADYGSENTEDTSTLPPVHSHHLLGNETLHENMLIKRRLDITYQSRPAWDFQELNSLGAERIHIDTGVFRRIYREKDEFYNPTPIFLICAEKPTE